MASRNEKVDMEAVAVEKVWLQNYERALSPTASGILDKDNVVSLLLVRALVTGRYFSKFFWKW